MDARGSARELYDKYWVTDPTGLAWETFAAQVSVFERYLTVWVFLCIVIGIALGQFLPGVFQVIGAFSVAQVNLPVGLLIWIMIIPMLVCSGSRRSRSLGAPC